MQASARQSSPTLTGYAKHGRGGSSFIRLSPGKSNAIMSTQNQRSRPTRQELFCKRHSWSIPVDEDTGVEYIRKFRSFLQVKVKLSWQQLYRLPSEREWIGHETRSQSPHVAHVRWTRDREITQATCLTAEIKVCSKMFCALKKNRSDALHICREG